MCVVEQHHLGKGARCAPPLHAPGLWRFPASSRISASKTYRHSITHIHLATGLPKCGAVVAL